MITLCSADREPDSTVLGCPGGFSWFYVDLIDEQGQGATVIWSWGLPFLPGYAGAARAGRPELPIDRPSVNVVVYGEGRERFYLLSELPRSECAWNADGRSWRLGDSTFVWKDRPGAPGAAPTRTVEAILDLALPTGGRVTGELRLSGPLRRDCSEASPPDSPADRTHTWTPMIAATRGSLELHTPSGDLRIDGRAYHDRNSATLPLHDLGIQSWWWGRLALPGRDLVFYRLTPSDPGACPRNLVVELAADGSSRSLETVLEAGRIRRSSWGLRWPETATFADPDGRRVEVEVSSVLDNGPFYQRYLLHGRCGDDEGYGVGENVVPDRVDTDLLRPLVRMRVHRAAGPNSMWLPLFSGDSAGRWIRLLVQAGKVRA